MPWVKIDEQFPRHPKIAAAGPLGMAMQVAALCYCNEYLTDGYVPRRVAHTLLNLDGIAMHMWRGELVGGGEDATAQLVIDDMIAAGLWFETDDGYEIHDYLEYQPSKAEVLAAREQRIEAGKLGGQASAQARAKRTAKHPLKRKLKQPLKQNASGSSSKTQAEFNPVPVPEVLIPVTGTTGRGAGTGTEPQRINPHTILANLEEPA